MSDQRCKVNQAKQVLVTRVIPLLKKGITTMCKDMPEDPILWLGNWLIENRLSNLTPDTGSKTDLVNSLFEGVVTNKPSADESCPRITMTTPSDDAEDGSSSVSTTFQRRTLKSKHLNYLDVSLSPSTPLSVLEPLNSLAFNEHVIELPRGGCIAKTSVGHVQFGVPPETLKDSLKMGHSVPTHFVIPPTPFRIADGLNVAEIEFPTYFNFFVKRQQLHIVTTKEMEDRIRIVFSETLFGPPGMDATPEFVAGDEAIPDLGKECNGLATLSQPGIVIDIDNMMRFTHFEFVDGALMATIEDNVSIRLDETDDAAQFVIIDGGKELCRVDAEVSVPPMPLPQELSVAFEPPLFGVTTLGNSTGFDPSGSTSGIVIWINQRGVMVDPPPHSGAVLAAAGIPAHLIEDVIVTHAHADHDAGLFQKIFSEKKITVTTSQTIMTSFLRKYAAITSLTQSYLQTFFHFRPAEMGTAMSFLGGEIMFHYALHTIPCVGFQIFFGGKSMVYTADHCNDPVMIGRLYDHGFMSKGRRDFLLNFPWHSSVIFHEAGPPPIHTPIPFLETLPDDVKSRMYLYHLASKDVGKGLKIAPAGVANTLLLDAEAPNHAAAVALLSVFSSIEIFSSTLPFSKSRDILQMVRTVQYDAGAVVASPGDKACFLVVMKGRIRVQIGDRVEVLGTGEFTGWQTLLKDQHCDASIVAESASQLLTLDKHDFIYLFRGTSVPQQLDNLLCSKNADSWQTIKNNSVLIDTSVRQRTELSMKLVFKKVAQGEILWSLGQPALQAALVHSGTFVVRHYSTPTSPVAHAGPRRRGSISLPLDEEIFVLGRGALFLEPKSTYTTTITANSDGGVFLLTIEQLRVFCAGSPGLLLRLFSTEHGFVDSVDSHESRVAQTLQLIPFLSDIDSTRLTLLASLFQFMETKKGESIFKEGEPSDCMVVIVSGLVEVYTVKKNEKHLLNKLGAGAFMGEIGLLHQCNRSATADAVEDCLMLCLTQHNFNRCLSMCPELLEPFSVEMKKRKANGVVVDAVEHWKYRALRRAPLTPLLSKEASFSYPNLPPASEDASTLPSAPSQSSASPSS